MYFSNFKNPLPTGHSAQLVIPALGMLRREDYDSKANLGYMVRPISNQIA